MRPDFAKLLVEHERRGSSKSYRRVRRAENHLHLVEDDEGIESDAPSKRSMLKANVAHWHGKEFAENLNPLRKWLAKNVGRPWNKVYSELRQQFKPTNTINAHIYQHLFQYVELNAVVGDDGEVRRVTQKSFYSTVDLYVDRDGILRKAKPWRRPSLPRPEPEYFAIDAVTSLAKVDGLWYRVEMRHISEWQQNDNRYWDRNSGAWRMRPMVIEDTVRGWPGDMIAVGRKQLSSKELRQHGLRNDP